MDTQLLQVPRGTPKLELDLIADLACPWSYIAKRSLERALDHLYGAPVRILRWHGLPLAGADRPGWREHLASRLPRGSSVAAVESNLRDTGSALGINFDFERLAAVPDTREAHRLVSLATRDGRQNEVIESLFSAFFEQGRDIASPGVLGEIMQDCQLDEGVHAAFADPGQARSDVSADEKRMRGLGIVAVPNVLINGRVLVPGPADVDTYVQALDQALVPEMPAPANRRRLH